MSQQRKIQRSSPPAGAWYLSSDTKRVVVEMSIGIGCYKGKLTESQWSGIFEGTTDSTEEAKKFLEGTPECPAKLSRIILDENKIFPHIFEVEITQN